MSFSSLFLALVSSFALLSLPQNASAAPSYSGREIVLGPGPIDGWDQAGVSQPSVLIDGGQYKMWYVGTDGLSTGIGYARSSDGTHWDRVTANALNISGPWPDVKLNPSVLPRPGGGYLMWFSGNLSGGSIGRAESDDGIRWTNATEVLGPTAGSWDAGGIGEPTVVYSLGRYWMWFVGVDASGGNASIGLATSHNGITWTLEASNPVIAPSVGGWDSAGLSSPGAAVVGSTFALWFAGSDGAHWRIGYAASPDGVSWSREGVVLDNGAPATADGSHAKDPSPPPGGGKALWYSGFDGATWRILVTVEAPPSLASSLATPANATIAVGLGLGAVGAAAFATSDRFKYALFAIPLGFKFPKVKNRDPFVRGQIYQYIRENPGDYYGSIMAATGATNGNLAYHLHTLEKEGFVKSVKDGRLVRFYPKGMPIPQKHGIRFSPMQVRMLELISQQPGITQADLGNGLGIPKATVGYNIWLLADEGIVEVKRIGRETYLNLTAEFLSEEDGD